MEQTEILTALALTELIARYVHMKKILAVSDIVFDFVRGLLMEEIIPNFDESEVMNQSRWQIVYEQGMRFREGVYAKLRAKNDSDKMAVFF